MSEEIKSGWPLEEVEVEGGHRIKVIKLSEEEEQTVLNAVSRRMGWDEEDEQEHAESNYLAGIAGIEDDSDEGIEMRELSGASANLEIKTADQVSEEIEAELARDWSSPYSRPDPAAGTGRAAYETELSEYS